MRARCHAYVQFLPRTRRAAYVPVRVSVMFEMESCRFSRRSSERPRERRLASRAYSRIYVDACRQRVPRAMR